MTIDSADQDRADMARLAEGRDAALNDLMARHSERLFHYLVRQMQNESEAADLAQETFVRVYQNRDKFQPAAKFTTWMYTIATNLMRDRFRWRSRHPQVSLDAESEGSGSSLQETLAEDKPEAGAKLAAEERVAAVRRVVAKLPEDLRTALLMAEYENMSHAEIGTVLGCSVKAVESRIFRARQQLRARLADVMQEL